MANYLNIDCSSPNPYQEFTIEGEVYILHNKWNSRTGVIDEEGNMSGAWELSLYKDDFPDDLNDTSTLVIAGRQIVPYQSLFDDRGLEGIFTGKVFCVDTAPIKDDNQITLDNFGKGKRWQLVYFAPDEL